MSQSSQPIGEPTLGQAWNAIRGNIVSDAILGLIIGIIGLVWPGPTLLVVAALFGIAVIVTGVLRLLLAFSWKGLSTGNRVLLGILGLLTAVAGLLCLLHPTLTLLFLALMIGIGWVFSGVHDLFSAFTGRTVGSKGMTILSGIVSVVAGIVVFTLPGVAVVTFVTWGSILLIVVSIFTLIKLPRKAKA